MTTVAQTAPANLGAAGTQGASPSAPASWRELRENGDIQFEPVTTVPPPPPEPREPGWFEQALVSFFQWLGELLAPIGQLLGVSWPVLQWILLALLVVFIVYFAIRTFGPMSLRGRNAKDRAKSAMSEPEWQPTKEESVALLEDADRLAAEGRFDEATHLLLMRSVTQISEARPDWVEPSSTSRELAALPALSNAARGAFATISERVERNLFALRSLDRSDWEAARKAYADFALARIEAPEPEAEAQRARGFGRKAVA
ncbi:MAG: hypothetical protein ACX930_10605 [Erythrobacter sp.]